MNMIMFWKMYMSVFMDDFFVPVVMFVNKIHFHEQFCIIEDCMRFTICNYSMFFAENHSALWNLFHDIQVMCCNFINRKFLPARQSLSEKSSYSYAGVRTKKPNSLIHMQFTNLISATIKDKRSTEDRYACSVPTTHWQWPKKPIGFNAWNCL